MDGQIQRRLNQGLIGRHLAAPTDSDAREGLGNEETIPGAKLPGSIRVNVEGPDRRTDKLCQLGHTGLGHHVGAARSVGCDGAVVAIHIRALEVAQANCAVAGAGASNGDEAETLDGTGDEFSIEAAADEDGDAVVAEAPGTGEEASVPKGIDGRRWSVIPRSGAGFTDIPVAEGHAQTANGHARDTWDEGEGEALLQRISGVH